MPLYCFSHPETGEYIEVVQGMNDKHEYIDEDGLKWQREWTVPQASVKESIDPFSKQDFAYKTGKKKGTMGDLIDQSREMSEERKRIKGKDDVKDKFFDNYAKERNGKRHWDDPKNKTANKIASID